MVMGAVSVYAASDLIFAGAKTFYEEELGIRKEPLSDEDITVPTHGETTKKEPGESTRFTRSFENSPPLIPHDITGMLPLAESDNICLGCHMPDEAPTMVSIQEKTWEKILTATVITVCSVMLSRI
jgi:nitrate reductase cytochrome c-type subunit